MIDLNTSKLIEELQRSADQMERDSLSGEHVTALIADLYKPHWLLLQKFMLQEVNGEMVKLTAKAPTAENLTEFARIQGIIVGIKHFWGRLEIEIERTEQEERKKNEPS